MLAKNLAVAAGLWAYLAMAAPQPQPQAGEDECTPHLDHWHCPPGVSEPTTPPATEPSPTTPPPPPADPETTCFPTVTEFPRLATFPEDGDAWAGSMNVKYDFEHATFSGYEVAISSFTTTFILGETTTVLTLTMWYDSNVITSEGLEVITQTETTTTCATVTDDGEPTDPPQSSSTASEPEPTSTGDHLDPSSTASEPVPTSTDASSTASASGECEPHNDHWKCPPGVSQPTTPPPQQSEEPISTAAPAGEDEPTSAVPSTGAEDPISAAPSASAPTDFVEAGSSKTAPVVSLVLALAGSAFLAMQL